jgi:8-oxo-dGTP pyrophosphatase MutT (NUDIX family)
MCRNARSERRTWGNVPTGRAGGGVRGAGRPGRCGGVARRSYHARMTPDDVRVRFAALPRPLPPPPAWLRPERMPEGIPFERPAAPPDARPAAALVLVYPGPGGAAHLVLTERVEYGSDHHSGEVSLPGGKSDPGDIDAVATALREAEEEIGLNPDATGVEVIGRLDALWIPPSNFLVTPIVAIAARRPVFIPDPREVAAILEAPVTAFLPDAQPLIIDPDPRGRPLRYGAYLVEGRIVWGATAAILGQLGAVLGAR